MTGVILKVQGPTMDVSQLKDLIPLFIAGLTTLGGAIAWVVNRIDRKAKEERELEKLEREKLEALFTSQISALQDEIHSQNNEIMQLRYELTVYVRHVGILEGMLKGQGIEPPVLLLDKNKFKETAIG